MRLIWTLLGSLVSASPAVGQLALYDAGTAGNPVGDPIQQGWALRAAGANGLNPFANDGPLNAWAINDSTEAGEYGFAYYYRDDPEITFGILSGAWEITATAKPTAGPDASLFLEVNSGATFLDTGYRVFFRIQGGDVIVEDGYDNSLFTCSGAADGQYHRFTLRKNSQIAYGPAEFLYDGVALGSVPEDWPGPYSFDDGAKFGTWTDYGIGRARFHRVEFRLLNDLGSDYCQPGVPNSTGVPAALESDGSPYLDQNLVGLTAVQLPTNQFGYLLASKATDFVPMAGGSQGNLCLGGSIARFVSQAQSSGAAGSFHVVVDVASLPTSPASAIQPGETWYFQAWYRDNDPGPTSNFTDGEAISFL